MRILSLLTILAICAVCFSLQNPAQGFQVLDEDEIFVFNNKMGAVTFNHSAHQAAFDCSSCHPPFEMKYDDDVSTKKEAHITCKNCHKAENGPTGCKDCHVK
jgi:hypothetical protein